MHPLVDALHEGVEMDAAFLLDLGRFGEEVHQHRLPPPDAAPEVEAFRRLDRLGEKAGEEPDLAGRVRLQPGAEVFEAGEEGVLGRVGAKAAAGHAGLVDLGQGLAHGKGIAGRGWGPQGPLALSTQDGEGEVREFKGLGLGGKVGLGIKGARCGIVRFNRDTDAENRPSCAATTCA